MAIHFKPFHGWFNNNLPLYYTQDVTLIETVMHMIADYNNNLKIIEDSYNNLESTVLETFEKWEKAFEDFTTNIENEWNEYKENLNSEWADYKTEMNAAFEQLRQDMEEYKNDITTKFNQLKSDFEALEQSMEEYKAQIDQEISTIKSEWEDYQTDLTGQWNTFKEDITGRITTVENEWSSYKTEMDQNYTNFTEDITNRITTVETEWSEFHTQVDEQISGLTEEWNQFKTTITGQISELTEEWAAWQSKHSQLWEQYKAGVDATIQSMQEQVDNNTTAIENMNVGSFCESFQWGQTASLENANLGADKVIYSVVAGTTLTNYPSELGSTASENFALFNLWGPSPLPNNKTGIQLIITASGKMYVRNHTGGTTFGEWTKIETGGGSEITIQDVIDYLEDEQYMNISTSQITEANIDSIRRGELAFLTGTATANKWPNDAYTTGLSFRDNTMLWNLSNIDSGQNLYMLTIGSTGQGKASIYLTTLTPAEFSFRSWWQIGGDLTAFENAIENIENQLNDKADITYSVSANSPASSNSVPNMNENSMTEIQVVSCSSGGIWPDELIGDINTCLLIKSRNYLNDTTWRVLLIPIESGIENTNTPLLRQSIYSQTVTGNNSDITKAGWRRVTAGQMGLEMFGLFDRFTNTYKFNPDTQIPNSYVSLQGDADELLNVVTAFPSFLTPAGTYNQVVALFLCYSLSTDEANADDYVMQLCYACEDNTASDNYGAINVYGRYRISGTWRPWYKLTSATPV